MILESKKILERTKIFEKGEYYQTYELQVNVTYNTLTNRWEYNTFQRKDAKDSWIICDCIEEKIVPIVKLMISDILKDLLVKDIVKCYF